VAEWIADRRFTFCQQSERSHSSTGVIFQRQLQQPVKVLFTEGVRWSFVALHLLGPSPVGAATNQLLLLAEHSTQQIATHFFPYCGANPSAPAGLRMSIANESPKSVEEWVSISLGPGLIYDFYANSIYCRKEKVKARCDNCSELTLEVRREGFGDCGS
jgi:hypothetical protein